MGSGVRYNFNPRYAVTAGVNWMHISNANLSEHKYDASQHDPWGVENFGINVVGPMFGVDIQLGKHRGSAE
jgi:long-subunit fatty acid transport protein